MEADDFNDGEICTRTFISQTFQVIQAVAIEEDCIIFVFIPSAIEFDGRFNGTPVIVVSYNTICILRIFSGFTMVSVKLLLHQSGE